MTFSFFIASLFLNLGMTSKLMAGQLFEFESWNKIKTFLTIIILVTLGLEASGAGLLFMTFRTLMASDQALFYSIFHSVSAFCNAGICLFDDSMMTMSGNTQVLGTLAGLVFAGGIGFAAVLSLLFTPAAYRLLAALLPGLRVSSSLDGAGAFASDPRAAA